MMTTFPNIDVLGFRRSRLYLCSAKKEESSLDEEAGSLKSDNGASLGVLDAISELAVGVAGRQSEQKHRSWR